MRVWVGFYDKTGDEIDLIRSEVYPSNRDEFVIAPITEIPDGAVGFRIKW